MTDTAITTPLNDLQQSITVLEKQIREIARQEIDAEGERNPQAPWLISKQNGDTTRAAKAQIRALEIERIAYRKACMLSGVGESLAILFQSNIEQMARELGPLIDWDGSENGLQLLIEASTPDHDTGDARGKRQFVKDTLPILKAAGVPVEEVAEIAARRSMRPRLAAAVNSIQNEMETLATKQEKIRQAASDAMTQTARAFDDQYKARRIGMLIYDESPITDAITRRVYLLNEQQRAMLSSMLQGREQKAPMPLERRPTLAVARSCVESGDFAALYVSLLPTVALEVYETINTWGSSTLAELSTLDMGMGELAGALSLLTDCGLVVQQDEQYITEKEQGDEKRAKSTQAVPQRDRSSP